MSALDPTFIRRINDTFGDAGRAWLDDLPVLLAGYARRWNLTLGAPYPLSYNYVAPATRADGERVVLKAGVQPRDASWEIATLRYWDGDGAVRLLESDEDAAVFLLERIEPGTPILEIDDADATRIAAAMMGRLWRPAPEGHSFPTVANWGDDAFRLLHARHGGGAGPLSSPVFDRGERLYGELAGTQAEAIVLHGDLHHWNILRAEREPWLVIDPHGVVGEPAFEVGAWMRNPVDRAGPDSLLKRAGDVRTILDCRLGIFSETLGLDRQRLRDWSIAICCLSAAWSDESGHAAGAAEAMAVAAHLGTL